MLRSTRLQPLRHPQGCAGEHARRQGALGRGDASGPRRGRQGVRDDYTLVTARYEAGGRVAGVLGVIGPTRMAYGKVIPAVDVTARLLGLAMAEGAS